MSDDKLTEAQRAQIEPYRQKWFDIGLNCDPLDWDPAVDAVGRAYKAAGLEAPRFYFAASSPISGAIAGVCLQRFFRALEGDLSNAKILDTPFLESGEKAVEQFAAALDKSSELGVTVRELIEQSPVLPTMKEYVDREHIEVFNSGKNLPLELHDVAADMRQQLAVQLVDVITEGDNDGPLPTKPGKAEMPTKLAPLGKTNGARYVAYIGMLLALLLKAVKPETAKALQPQKKQLALALSRYVRRGLHSWLLNKLAEAIKRELPAEIDAEFARGCSQQFSEQANGNHDTTWSCFYDFLFNVCGVKEVEAPMGLLDLAKSCGWWTPLRWVAILQHRPAEMHVDEQGRLHRDGGPVTRFRDGFKFWILHSVTVTQEIAETPGEKLDPKLVLETVNADQRREILRKIGIERYVHKIGAKSLDKEVELRDRDGFLILKEEDDFMVYRDAEKPAELIPAAEVCEVHYELLEFPCGQNRTARALKMSNPSLPEVWHVECVPVTCATVQDAINFRNGVTAEQIDDEAGAWMVQQGDVLVKPRGAKTFRSRPLQLT